MWSAGCVIAEMFIGSPLFAGKSTADQLLQIVKVQGSSHKDYLAELLKIKGISIPFIKGTGLFKKIENVESLLVDLLEKTFAYEPNERITPLEALMHPYFDELRVKPVYLNNNVIVDNFDFSEEEIGNYGTIRNKLIPDWYTKQ